MRKSSDFPFITSKHPLLMSQLPFEQYRIIFKLIKTRQQYAPFLTQVSLRDSYFINLRTTTLQQRKDINHVSRWVRDRTLRASGLSVMEKCWGNWDYIRLVVSLTFIFFCLLSLPDNQSAIFLHLMDTYDVLVVLQILRWMWNTNNSGTSPPFPYCLRGKEGHIMSGSKNKDHIVMFIKHKEAVALFSEHSIQSDFSALVPFFCFCKYI